MDSQRRNNRPEHGRETSRRRSSSGTSPVEERRKSRHSRRDKERNHERRRERSRRNRDRSLSTASEESSRRHRRRKGRRSRSRSPSHHHSRSRSSSRQRRPDRDMKREDRHEDGDRLSRRSYQDDNRSERRRRSWSRLRSNSPPRRSSRRQKRRRKERKRRQNHSLSLSHSSTSSTGHRRHRNNRDQAPPKRAGVVSVDEDAMAHNNAGLGHGPRGGAAHHQSGYRHDNARQQRNHHNNHNSDHDKKRKRDSAQSSSLARDDTVGHFWGGPGTIIADTYRVERELGMGTFGRVVECLDLRNDRKSNQRDQSSKLVAIKMVRKVKRYYESALIEADIVSDVNRRGGPRGRGTSHFAIMYDAFNFRGHYCLVFESLGPSLYDYLKRNKYRPFPMRYVHDFSKQLLEAIEFLHSFRLIHTDLKLENILVTKCREVPYGHQMLPELTKIKVIDFGGATYDDDKKSSVVNTRQYRAPEVILSCGWSMPSDLWSAGCILCELYTGELLFATHDNLEHLALIERIIGPFPRRMLERANHFKSPFPNQAFDESGRHRLDRVLPKESASHVRNMKPLEAVVSNKKDAWFLNLLRNILVIDPECRSSARDALRNCFE